MADVDWGEFSGAPSFAKPFSLDGDSPLEQIAAERAKWTDTLLAAINEEARTHNEYLECYGVEYAHATQQQVPVSGRDKHVNAMPEVSKAKQAWNWAKAAKQQAREKCSELEARHMDVMSFEKTLRGQT